MVVWAMVMRDIGISSSKSYEKLFSFRLITVPLPLQRYRDSPSATVTDRYGPFTTVTERYRPLPNLTVTCVTSVKKYQRYINIFYETLNICSKGPFRIGNACNARNGKIR